MIQITCKGNSASCTRAERLTSGMVGLQCEFVFDGAWDGLARTAVFLAGNEKRDVLLTGDTCTVPWEVLKTAGYQLVIGVYGTNAEGTLVTPTVYAMCGGIASGADPSGDESTDPTLPVWGQMQGMIGDLSQLQTSAKSNMVDAINEAAQSGGGSAVELDTTLTQSGKAADAKAVGDALAEKQPKGDYLTQNELQGATDAALAQAKESGEFDGADGVTPSIGDNGNWYLGTTDTGKPSRGDKGDKGDPGDTPDMTAYRTAEAQNVIDAGKQDVLIQSGAHVGQVAKITAVDDSGKPTAWEAVDMASGEDGWTEIGEITLEGTEFIISAYSDGVVTIAPENGVYPQVNKNTVLRKSDYSSYINVRFIATGTDGQYKMKNLDGAVYAPSDDLTQYVVDVPSADSISFSNIPAFSFFKAKITTPLLCVHGIRMSFSSSYEPFNIVGSDCVGLSGGAAEVVLETEDSPIAGKIYSKGSFKGKSASRADVYDIIRMFDRPTAPANINFFHYSGLLTIGTKVKLWGRN